MVGKRDMRFIILIFLSSCIPAKKVVVEEEVLSVPHRRVKLAEKLCRSNGGLKEFKKGSFVCANSATFNNK